MARGQDKTRLLAEAHNHGYQAQKTSLQAQGVTLPQHNVDVKAKQAKKKTTSAKTETKKAGSTKPAAKKTAVKKSTAKKTVAKKTATKKS